MDTEHAVMEQQQACIVRSLLNKLERQDNEDKEFVRLRNQSIKYRDDKTYASNSAEAQENIKKNRYKDILPFDHSRVKLTLTTSKDDSDYINASFIKGVTGTKAYIATQGPLHHTVLDFLRMLWEYDIKVVVMACREFEMGKKKCERYWPHKEEKSKACGPFIVDCDCEEDKGAYLTRTLRLTYDNQHRTLKQLHYVHWPDHGVPDSIPSILDLLEEMRTYQSHDDIPLCIHCSAGCGRTGVLCIIDYTWNLLKNETITPDFKICDLVHTMRTQRPSVVQTKEQYELVYSAIRLLFERYLQSMDEQSSKNQLTRAASMREQDLGSQELQCQRGEEMNNIPQKQKLGPSVPEGHLKDRNNQPDQPQLLHGAVTSRQEEILQNGVHTVQEVAAMENIWQGDDIPSPKPPPSPTAAAAAASAYLLMEDPYFDSPPFDNAAPLRKPWTVDPIFSHPSSSLNDHTLQSESTVTSGAHTDEDVPPPLPERTPESYQLFVDTGNCMEPNLDDLEHSNSSERLTITIPPSEVAEAVQDNPRESPVTPAPSLPDRTPESYELASHQAPVASQPEVTPAANLNRIGTSSEWSGTSELVADSFERETKPWVRSKSLRVKMTFTEPLTPAWLSPAPLEGGSAQVEECDVNQKASLADGVMSGDKSEKSNEKGPSCKKKLFRDKQKTKPATPALPSSPKGVVTSFFKFGNPRPSSSTSNLSICSISVQNRFCFVLLSTGFGKRLGKPKGPRNYPQSWF